MAFDLSLLEDNPQSEPRFRHYRWSEATATFGYTQSLSEVTEHTVDWQVSLMRRPSGGGIVDHRADWTYALILPESHLAAEQRPVDIYEQLHGTLQQSLATWSLDSELARAAPCTPSVACFSGPVRYDLVEPSGEKIAGAAMKRTRNGILIQGTIVHPAGPPPSNFLNVFQKKITNWLESEPHDLTGATTPTSQAIYEGLAHSYRLEKWNQRRP